VKNYPAYKGCMKICDNYQLTKVSKQSFVWWIVDDINKKQDYLKKIKLM